MYLCPMNENNQLVTINQNDNNSSVINYYASQQTSIDSFVKAMVRSINVGKTPANLKLKGTTDEETQDNILSCVLTGMEIGLAPMQSLKLADKLNDDGYLSIVRGRDYNMNPIAAMENIHIIPTKNGRQTFLGVHVVTKILIENNINITILLDYQPMYSYATVDFKNNSKQTPIPIDDVEDESFKVKDKFCIFSTALSATEVQQAMNDKKVFIIRTNGNDKRTAVKLTREGRSDIYYCFTTKDAVEEGVYPGTNKIGEIVPGDASWIKHTRSKMMKTCIERAGRLIADDKLQGGYTTNELSQFIVNKQIDATDAEVVKVMAIEDAS